MATTQRKKTSLPRFDVRRGVWVGGDTRTLYTFVAKHTGTVGVYPGGGLNGKLLMSWGPEATVRGVATRAEAEEHWQNPLHGGWKVAETGSQHATKKYSKKASEKVGQTMHEFKGGKLKSGGSGKKVTSRKQAIAIGLSQARRAGYKVPSRSGSAHSKMLSSPVVLVDSVTMPTGKTAEIHIHHGKGGYNGVLVFADGNELPMSVGKASTAAEAMRGAKKFLAQVYGRSN